VGAFRHTNSWHHDTGAPARYTEEAADVDAFTFVNEDHVVLGSAGNRGEEQGPPGTAKNAICVAAANVNASRTQFGDGVPGPTADDRQKPDLMAPGCKVESAKIGTGCGTGKFGLLPQCASSFATPRAAGFAALVRQYFREGWHPSGNPMQADETRPSGALIKAVLINAATPLTSIPERPSPISGWGLLQAERALVFAGDRRTFAVFDVRHADGPTLGETRSHQVTVPSDAVELRATLVWSDPPPAAVEVPGSLVNHLRLRLTSPNGIEHAGKDGVDPVVSILVPAPEPGQWRIDVHATEVNMGKPGQGYALIALAEAT
jgi:hypothetical protein